MSLPTILVEIAFATLPAATPTWTDVTDYVKEFHVRRGRTDELARFSAGTATVVLDNPDRRFDPTYTTGAYYPNVLPMRRLRISATWSAVTYRLFTGYIEGWPQAYPGPADATVTVTAVDAFAALGLAKLSGSYTYDEDGKAHLQPLYGVQSEYARVAAVLDSAGWPSSERNIIGGQSDLQTAYLVNTAALDHLQTVAASTNARLFVAGDGDVTWISRHAINQGDYATSQQTYGEGAGELPYSDVTVGYDVAQVYNEVRCAAEGGIEQTASDATSQGKYFKRTLPLTGLAIASDNEAADMATWMLAKYKDPTIRILGMVLDPEGNDSLWPGVLGYDLGTRVTVKRRPEGDPSGIITQVSHIESIQHDWQADGARPWAVTWGLTAAEVGVTYFLLDDPTYGLLDTSSITY